MIAPAQSSTRILSILMLHKHRLRLTELPVRECELPRDGAPAHATRRQPLECLRRGANQLVVLRTPQVRLGLDGPQQPAIELPGGGHTG